MYVAYSEKLNRKVNVHEVYNLNEVFCCPNPFCSAKYKIKSATGKRAKHFAKLKTTRHIESCSFENGDSRYTQPSYQVRKSVEEIFEDFLNPNSRYGVNPIGDKSESDPDTTLKINTPKKLLKFCLLNQLDEEYQEGVTVDDIILEPRNLFTDARFEGVEGIRFLVGETVDRYRKNEFEIRVTAISKNGKKVYLHAVERMDIELLQYVRTHIENTYGSFEGHPIAVFGKWKIDRKYHISCTVPDRKHIVMRF